MVRFDFRSVYFQNSNMNREIITNGFGRSFFQTDPDYKSWIKHGEITNMKGFTNKKMAMP